MEWTLRLCILAGLSAVSAAAAIAQSQPNPPELTVERAKDFLTAAGLQTCETSEIDPAVSQIYGATRSLSIGVAKDCAQYDPKNPTVVNVYQFVDEQKRDAMVATFQDLRFRALRPYGNVWTVESFVIVLLGPQRDEAEALIKAEYLRRNPGAG
jgi:hypothetical protein